MMIKAYSLLFFPNSNRLNNLDVTNSVSNI